jgi:hypothetical protein
MAILGIGKKDGPSPQDQAIFTNLSGPTIDRDDAAILKELLKPIDAKTRKGPEQEIQSLTVPRTDLRKRILDDVDFRRALRNMPFKISDLSARKMELTDPVSADVYIKDTKYNGLKHTGGESLIPFDIRMRALENWAGDWGYVKIPAAILVLIAGGMLYCAYRLAMHASKVISDYSDATAAAIQSDAGLEKAIKARSGMQPQGRQGETEASPKPTDTERAPAQQH